jgi:hypothetical protein
MGLLLNIVPGPAAASANSCLSVVRAWKEAVDCQSGGQVEALTWADGYTQWPLQGRGKWSDIRMSGPCGKYATAFKEVRALPILRMSQIVEVKAVTRQVGPEGRYTGDYMVTREAYTCKQRNGQWRIYSQVVTQRTDLQNRAVPRRYGKGR